MIASEKTKLRKRTMRYSIIDHSLFNIMTQTGIQFLTPFAIALNSPLLIISMLNSFPPLLDGIAQKIGAYFSDFGWERKKIIVYGVAVQTFLWFFLALFAYYSNIFDAQLREWVLIILVVLIFFGAIVNPAWFALIGDVIPKKIIASWFGQKNRIAGVVGIIALLFAGFFLDWMKKDVLVGFAILFGIASLARGLSTYFLALHWDPSPKPKKEHEPKQDVRAYALIVFVLFFAINIGMVYALVYVLKILKFDYFWFSAMFVAHAISYSLSAPHWGRLIEKYGTKKTFVCSTALCAIPILMWLFVNEPIGAIFLHIVGGIVWAGMYASYFNYIYEITKPDERIKAMGHVQLFCGAGIFFGVMGGGFLLTILGENSIHSFYILFAVIALLRIIVALIIHLKLKEIKTVPGKKGTLELMANILTVYPIKGLMYDVKNIVKKVKI